MPEIYNVQDLMKILKLSRHTVERIMKQKYFPRVPGTKRLLVEKEAFLKWLKNEQYEIKS